MDFKIKDGDYLFSEIKKLSHWEGFNVSLLSEEVTRALEPTYSKEREEVILDLLHSQQRILNRKKNLYSKILKELLKSSN